MLMFVCKKERFGCRTVGLKCAALSKADTADVTEREHGEVLRIVHSG